MGPIYIYIDPIYIHLFIHLERMIVKERVSESEWVSDRI